jgi:hypothetical protein
MGVMFARIPGAVLGALLLSLAGCMHAPPPPVAKLKVEAEPETTTVYVNGKYAGRAKVLAVKAKELKPGVTYITFKAPGYFPHDVRLRLPPGTTSIKMKLRPIPP